MHIRYTRKSRTPHKRDSLLSKVIGYRRGGNAGILLFGIAFIPAVGPTQSPIEWITGILSLVLKRPHDGDQSPSSSVEVQNAWSIISTLLQSYVLVAWCLSIRTTSHLTLNYKKTKIKIKFFRPEVGFSLHSLFRNIIHTLK